MNFALSKCAPFCFAVLFAMSPWAMRTAAASDVSAVLVNGKPVTVTWADGRSAALLIYRKPPIRIAVPFKIESNECSDFLGSACQVSVSTGMILFQLRWTAHPQPEKIGQVVEFRKVGDPTENNRRFAWEADLTSPDRGYTPKLAGAMLPDAIQCSDYSWLPGVPVGTIPDHLDLVRWDVEKFEVNPETGLMENRSVGGALGLEYMKSPAGGLELRKLSTYTGPFPGLLTSVNALNLVAASPSGGFCHISLQVDVRSYYLGYVDYTTIDPAYAFESYIYSSDEYSNFNSGLAATVNSHGYLPYNYVYYLMDPGAYVSE